MAQRDAPVSTRLRLFTALWPGPAVRAALAARRDALEWPPGAARVPDDRLHLTLHFLGAVSVERLPDLVAGLQVPCRAFVLRIGDTRAWPGGLVVVQPQVVPDALRALHAALGAALARLQLPVGERTFRPHVTLARKAGGARWPDGGAAPLNWTVSGYVLVWSAGGDGYRVLARYTPRGITLPTARSIATARSRPAPAPSRR